MFLQDLGQFFGEWDGAFFPIFRQKRILRFCPDVDSPVCQVQVRPVERLEFAAAKACREH
jgi:peroxiredoxin